jgi:hypothetical protein
MSTELFRKYIDILKEHTDAEIEQLNKALSTLETVLGKYLPQLRNPLREVDLYTGPGSGGRTAAQQAAMDALRSGAPIPPEPVPPPKSTMSKVWDATKAGAGKAANLAKKIPIPKVGTATKAVGYGLAGLAAIDMYRKDVGNLIADWLESTEFSKLPPADQEIIKTNWAVVEPYAQPKVIETLPTGLQTRIGHVINLLKKLDMVIQGYEDKSFVDRVKGLGDYVPFTVSMKNSPDAPAADPSKPPEKETFDQLLQKASKNAQGVQESELSDVERMAQLRDILKDDIALTDPIKDKWSAFLSSVLGVPGVIAASPVAFDVLSVLLLQYNAAREASGGGPATFSGLAKWILKTSKWKKWALSTLLGGAALGVQVYGIKAALNKVKDVADARGSDIDATQAVIDAYETMTDEEYAALSKDDKIKLDTVLLSYCWDFPQKPGCMNMQKDMVKKHPDWTLVQKIMKIHPEWPEVKQICQANPNLPGCQV